MPKFVVDPDTLQYVSNALGALSQDFGQITSTTSGLTPQELGGRSVLRHLEDFDDRWSYGRTVVDEEITGMSKRLATAKHVYELIEEKVQHGANGTIDLGRWGTAHIGTRTGGSPAHHHHRPGTGTGTTTIGGPGHHHGSGTGTATVTITG
jgi:hypothetical protein